MSISWEAEKGWDGKRGDVWWSQTAERRLISVWQTTGRKYLTSETDENIHQILPAWKYRLQYISNLIRITRKKEKSMKSIQNHIFSIKYFHWSLYVQSLYILTDGYIWIIQWRHVWDLWIFQATLLKIYHTKDQTIYHGSKPPQTISLLAI